MCICVCCRHAASNGQDCNGHNDVHLLFSKELLREKEEKLSEMEKQKREAESKLTAAERAAQSLRFHMGHQEINHIRCTCACVGVTLCDHCVSVIFNGVVILCYYCVNVTLCDHYMKVWLQSVQLDGTL